VKEVVQIVPRLPPVIDGIGDYAVNLARRLRKDFGINTHFIVCDPAWNGATELEAFPVSRLTERSVSAITSLLSNEFYYSSTILLQYSGYGYEKRGCPQWLVSGLQRWRRMNQERRLITMFHELFAYGPVWTSSFWLSSLQKKLAARLVRLSDRSLTNREAYAAILYRLGQSRDRHIPVMPVFSNVGEPECLPPALAERKRRRLAVFGNRGHRHSVFQKSLNALSRTCKAFDIDEILDIGPHAGHGVTRINNIPVISTGAQTAQEVSSLLLTSIVGFFSYPTDYLGKSGVFAAYCAHRLLPIGVCDNGRPADGLTHEHHFWLAEFHKDKWSLDAGQDVANNAYRWYHEHNLSKHADVFATCLITG
jgi:hypothetical protein